MKKFSVSNIKAQQVIMSLLFIAVAFLSGCASNMSGYYADLRKDLEKENFKKAAEAVIEYKDDYGSKNALMFYLDAGITNHYNFDYEDSKKYFEAAKKLFDDFYTKSISAAVMSTVYNDSSLPYYGEDFESIHINVFNALNYILAGQDNEAVVEARQADFLFRSQYRKVYKDDGFVRYFMGLVYENGGYLNDARVSYFLAINAYENGINGIKPPSDLINDAYSAAVKLGAGDLVSQIKSKYPQAQKKEIPANYGECIVIDYNGIVPRKVENVLNIALFRAMPYIDASQVDDQEKQDFQTAKSAAISVFANDYIKVAFPTYKRIPHKVTSFEVSQQKSVIVQDIAEIAEKTLKSQIAKIYGKTIARAAVKYIIGKTASKVVEKEYGAGWGMLAQISANAYNSLSERADVRAWNTLPENILMARFNLPAGKQKIVVTFFDQGGGIVKKQEIDIDVKAGKKNFVVIASPM